MSLFSFSHSQGNHYHNAQLQRDLGGFSQGYRFDAISVDRSDGSIYAYQGDTTYYLGRDRTKRLVDDYEEKHLGGRRREQSPPARSENRTRRMAREYEEQRATVEPQSSRPQSPRSSQSSQSSRY